ncbi:uncharacterized protein LOC144860030 [Branchiostoma floridae x Branchiostoma japonicum]
MHLIDFKTIRLIVFDDEEFHDEFGPLRVDVKYMIKPAGLELASVRFPGDGPATSIDIVFNLFSGWVFYTPLVDIVPGTINIEVIASSADGRSTTILMDPTFIEAPDNGFLLAYMEEFFDSQAGPFYNLLSMGFSAEAFGVPMVASGVVLYLASEGENTSEFTDIVTENMANAEIPDYDGIIGLANCIALVTAFPQFVSGDAQSL